MDSIAVLLIFAAVAATWWSTVGARNAARNAARRACSRAGVAFIDELAFKQLSIGRDSRGMLCIKRCYGFEFYVRGDFRYAGQVDMAARRVVAVQLDPYPEPADSA